MGYLNLDKEKLVNLEYSLYREVLQTNRAGSYCSTTIINCNTRKYHGMLVCPIDDFNGEKFVLLSSLDVSLVQHNQAFNLGIRKYGGNNYEPKGHKYLTDLDMDIIPRRIYRVGGMVFSTETLLSENEEQVLLKVTLEQANSATKIRFKPFLAYRHIHDLTKQNMFANTRCEAIANGVKAKMYDGFPYLNMQLSKKNEFIPVPDWYLGVEYIKEKNRGYDYSEDLFVPGYFEADIEKGESIVFSASTSEIKPNGLKNKFTSEKKNRIPRNTLFNCLMNAGGQFVQNRNGKLQLTAGFHWYKEFLRETFVALPGLTMFAKDKEVYLKILDQAIVEVKKRYLINCNHTFRTTIKSADVPLWVFYTLQEIEQIMPEIDIFEKYGNHLHETIQFLLNQHCDFLNINENGLIYAKFEGKPLTWMDAIVNCNPVTWRPGFAVEVNALWYNALCWYSDLCLNKNKKNEAKEYAALAQKVKESFVKTFWNEKGGYLYDYADGDYRDDAIRPNQVIATALRYSPLDMEKQKMVIDTAKKELLTPFGLRSLSPQSPLYEGIIEGNQSSRDLACHQGAVFPWITSFFADAYLKIHKKSGIPFIKKMLEEIEDEMRNHGLATISECYNGNPPHHAKGAVSMAWNVASILKVIKIIEKQSLL